MKPNMENVAIRIFAGGGGERLPVASMKVGGLAAPGGSRVTAGMSTPMPREAGVIWMVHRVIDSWNSLRGCSGSLEEKAIYAMMNANPFALPYANPANGRTGRSTSPGGYGGMDLAEVTRLALAARGYTRVLACMDNPTEVRNWRLGRISFRGADTYMDTVECGVTMDIFTNRPGGAWVEMSNLLGAPMQESAWFHGCADEDGSAIGGREDRWMELEGKLERFSSSDTDFFERLVKGTVLHECDLADAERILRLAAMHGHVAVAAESEWFMPEFSERYVRPLSPAGEGR